jgi:hypothetical protein
MKFHAIYQQTSPDAQSPIHLVDQTTGQGVDWVNRYLDREYVRRLANTGARRHESAGAHAADGGTPTSKPTAKRGARHGI